MLAKATDKQKEALSRITSYNVCYTKLLRAAESSPLPGKPFSFEQLRIPGWPQWISANIDALKVERLIIRDAEAPLWRLDEFSSRVRLHKGAITLSEITLVADEGRLAGSLEADPVDLRLSGSLKLRLAEPIVDVDQLFV